MSYKHFAHFIAIFNCALKHKKYHFTFALRRKKILDFLDFLVSRELIAGYNLPAGADRYNIPNKLGSMRSNYYYPVTVLLRVDKYVSGIKVGSTAGNRRSMRKEEVFVQARKLALGLGSETLIFLSDRFRGFCTIAELANCGAGGVLVCRVKLSGLLRDSSREPSSSPHFSG